MNPKVLQSTIREQMRKRIPGLSTCACGEGPVLIAMVAAKELGATIGVLVSYANSGDALIGSPDRVVGYGAVVFDKGVKRSETHTSQPPVETKHYKSLGDAEKRWLLALARKTITQYITTETLPLVRIDDADLNALQGAFVTIIKHGRLRGCIGHMAEDMPLCKVVGTMALQAAFNDRRFPSLDIAELDDIEIEISVLTPYRSIPGPEEIVLGRDGVVLRKDGHSAVYLPKVAVEQGWGVEETLEHLCQKAGLPTDAWCDNAELMTFQAIVFSENDYK